MNDRPCLLLTSTIQVDHPEFLRAGGRTDTQVRLNDYVRALESWLTRQHVVSDIVVVDNSGYPLEALQAVVDRHASAGTRVELISFRTTGYSESRGRSFGELDIIDTALRRSELLRGHTHVAKVTGRVFVSNVDAIVAALAADFDIVGRLSHNLTWLDTVFVLFRRELLESRLMPFALAHVDDRARQHVERVLARACLHAIADGNRWYPFPEEPRIEGVRGIDGRPYGAGALRALAIDWVGRAYDRASDNSRGAAAPHPMERWTTPRPGDQGRGDEEES